MSELFDAMVKANPDKLWCAEVDSTGAQVMRGDKYIGTIRRSEGGFIFVAPPKKKGALVQVRSAQTWKTVAHVFKALTKAHDGFSSMGNCKCKHCNKPRGNHRAVTFECPTGTKARAVGYTSYGPDIFSPKPATAKDLIMTVDAFKI